LVLNGVTNLSDESVSALRASSQVFLPQQFMTPKLP
jgi:hypothetical protein